MNNMEAIKYKNGKLAIINQILLPFRTEFLEIKGSQDAWNAIKLMQVYVSIPMGHKKYNFREKKKMYFFLRE